MSRHALVLKPGLLLFALGLLLSPGPALAEPATVPDVQFVILRLDDQSYAIKGGYQFSQPFRKPVPPEHFVRVGDIEYRTVPAGDFGYTEIRSRLTGQLVARASTIWMGRGRWEFPDSVPAPIALGGIAPDPASLDRVGGSPDRADAAWASARQAQPLESLAATGRYEVVIFEHFYTVGMSDPTTAEWIVVAFSRPPAPTDAGVIHVGWPYTVVSRGVPTAAEVTVTNFSDEPETFGLELRVEQSGALLHTSRTLVESLSADASRVVTFDPFTPEAAGSLSFSFTLVGPLGGPWVDTFSDNDQAVRAIEVVDDAVFRPIASLSRPGPIPTEGEPVDLDGDGDLDLFQYDYQPVLWRCTAGGTYEDITGLTSFVFPHWPRLAVAEDFDGDTHPDLLVVYFSQPPVLLHGDGTGAFTDMTAAAGLSGVTSYYNVAVLDLEGDGDRDLIFQVHGQERVLSNDGHGHFADVTSSSGLVDPNQTEDVAVGDVNGDGHPDVFVTNWGAASALFVNDGDGTFTRVPGPWSEVYGRQVLFLDADGDGRQDILFLHDSRSWLYRNTGGLSFADVSTAWGVNQPAFAGAVADLNEDGLPEVVLTSISGYFLLFNQGNSFVDRTSLLVNVDGAYALSNEAPRLVDLDGDGYLDVYQQSAVYLDTGGSPDHPSFVGPTLAPGAMWAFPNPFSPQLRAATVRFAMGAVGPVRVTVRDVSGRMVRRLIDGVVGAGQRSVTWDGRDDAGRLLPPGVYFCSVESSASRSTRRIAMLR
jgi:hypothetical protein